jgi:hypothetical protein
MRTLGNLLYNPAGAGVWAGDGLHPQDHASPHYRLAWVQDGATWGRWGAYDWPTVAQSKKARHRQVPEAGQEGGRLGCYWLIR